VAHCQAAQGLDVTVLKLAAELDHLLAHMQSGWSITREEHALCHAHQDQATLATSGLALE
jgi:hypothetical protein